MSLLRADMEEVLRATPEKRYWHFVDQVAASKIVWVLSGDESFFPVWPAHEFAELYCRENAVALKPSFVSLSHFLDVILPSLQQKGVGVSVLPVGKDRGIAASAGRLAWDLDQQLGGGSAGSTQGDGSGER